MGNPFQLPETGSTTKVLRPPTEIRNIHVSTNSPDQPTGEHNLTTVEVVLLRESYASSGPSTVPVSSPSTVPVARCSAVPSTVACQNGVDLQKWFLYSAGCPLCIVPVKSLGADGINQLGSVRSSAGWRHI